VALQPSLTFEFLCDILEHARLLTPAQKQDAASRYNVERARMLRARGAGPKLKPGEDVHPAEVLSVMGFGINNDERYPLNERLIMQTLAKTLNYPFVDLDPLKIDAKLAPQLLSRPFARRHTALVIAADDRNVTVAVANPLNIGLVDDLTNLVRRNPKLVIATPSEIQRLITDFYGFRGAVAAAEVQVSRGVDIGNLEQLVTLTRVQEIEASDAHIISAVEYILHYALDQRASDIHIEPRRDQSAVRMRIDGVLHTVHSLPKPVHGAVVSRIKTLARLDIAEKRRAQDGRIKTARGDREVELRVSTIHTAFGEKLVLRVFDPEAVLRGLSELGMFDAQLAVAEKFFSRPNGLILVTGPTGSGKTSTLYATLRAIATPEINIVTIEDPIELVVESFNQIAVQPKIGLDFAEALRHVLRQDPDVIMVGEVRDPETANVTLQSALTGHLVLATLHTNDSAGAITRLLELGVDPFILASTLVGVIAQRLVRLVCPNCRIGTYLTPDQMQLIGLDMQELEAQGENPQLQVSLGEGCVKCRQTGLVGRSGVFEVLAIDDKIRKLIIGRGSARDIMKQARNDGLTTLRESAIRKLARGETSFDEVLRVTVEG
jgi:general secretion pathway protein E